MIRLAISVEGRTEEEFARGVLPEHLASRGVDVTPVLFGSAGNLWKGGSVSETVLVAEMKRLFASFDAVTSLVDFYGFRGRRGRTVELLLADLRRALVKQTAPGSRGDRLVSYVQMHEFEALLFTCPEAFRIVPGVREESIARLREVRLRFRSPEEIDDGAATAPSKRIMRDLPGYQKVVDGPSVIRRIGLAAIRAECRRFDAWLSTLEALDAGGRLPELTRQLVHSRAAAKATEPRLSISGVLPFLLAGRCALQGVTTGHGKPTHPTSRDRSGYLA